MVMGVKKVRKNDSQKSQDRATLLRAGLKRFHSKFKPPNALFLERSHSFCVQLGAAISLQFRVP